MSGMAEPQGEISQTLDRGLTVLSLIAGADRGLSPAELADAMKIARAVVYRLLRTLEMHNLVIRIESRYVLGFGLADLAARLQPTLVAAVLPILKDLSDRTGATALLSVADGDQALVLVTAVPPRSAMHLAMREGARRPLEVGADGIAILAGRPEVEGESDDVTRARRLGYATSIGSIQDGAAGVAAPISITPWATASIGIVQLGVAIPEASVSAVIGAAEAAAKRLSGVEPASVTDAG
jgi:DNA-binding IclR family transcriptional regulator